MSSRNKKNRKKVLNDKRRVKAEKATTQGISLNGWNNPRNLYEKLPIATSVENKCPNCSKPNLSKIKV